MLLLPLPASATPIVADLHLDTPTQLVRRDVGLDGDGLEAGLAELRAGGVNLVVEVLWPPRAGDWEAHVDRLFTKMEAEDARLEGFTLVGTPAQARKVVAAGGIAGTVSLEGTHGIDRSGLDGLRRLAARGLSMVGLTWSFSNRFAGSSGDGGGGLTEAGRELVAEASRLGLLIDVSHASEATTLETCRLARSPVVASHSNTDAVRPHARNLSDAEIRCIAETGGVIGLNSHAPFVAATPSVAALADHADHLRAIGGLGVVALGSDFDGMITVTPGLPTAAAVPSLWAELARRGWTETELSLVKGENYLRAWAVARNLAGLPP